MHETNFDAIQTRWALLETSITRASFTGIGCTQDICRPCSCSGLFFTWKSTA